LKSKKLLTNANKINFFVGKITFGQPLCDLENINAEKQTILNEKVAKIKDETEKLESGVEISNQFRKLLLGLTDCFHADISPKKLNAEQKETLKNCILQRVVDIIEDESGENN